MKLNITSLNLREKSRPPCKFLFAMYKYDLNALPSNNIFRFPTFHTHVARCSTRFTHYAVCLFDCFPRHLVLCKKEKVYRHYSSFILPDNEIDRHIDKMRVEPNGYYNWSVCLSSMKTSMQFYTSHFYLPLSRFCQYENIIKTK